MVRLSRQAAVPAAGSRDRGTDRLQGLVLAVGLVLVSLVWGGLLYHLHLRETAVREQVHHDVANLSIGVEKHVERLLVGVDQVMRFIADDFTRDPDGFDFAAWLQRSTSLQGVAHQISLFDRNGELVASRTPRVPGMPRFNVRDRDYFLALQASAERGLYIDRTLLGRITGRHVMQTARRLNDRDGGFAGVIVTSISPDYLTDQFRAVDVGEKGSIALIGQDGGLRARAPQVPGMYEINTRDLAQRGDLFDQLAEREAGTFDFTSPYDGVRRAYGYRRVGALPLVVNVGKSLEETMAPLVAERRRAYLAGAGVTLALCLTLLALARGLEKARRQGSTLAVKEAAASAAEAKAREANRLLTLAVQIAHIGHWRIDLPGNGLFWSEEVFAIHGRKPEAGEPPLDEAIACYHPDDREEVARCIAAAIETGASFALSARIVHAEDGQRDVVCRGLCETDAAGTTTAVFGTIMDVTELRRTERAAIESEARFRLLAENTSELIMLGHDDGRRSYISPASERLLGLTPDELAALSLRDYVHPDDLPRLFAATRSLSRDARDEASLEYRARHKERGWVWVEGIFRRIPGAGPDAPTIVASFRDISERREQARALEEAKLSAERASAAKTDFLAAMSHEIRTPLNGVIGYADLLLEERGLPEPARQHVRRIRAAGSALLTVVNDILDFSRIEAGAIELHPETFDLPRLIDGAAAMVGVVAEQKGLALAVEMEAGLPALVVGDQGRLRQVLLNLLNNAVKFTRAGTVTLAVRRAGGGLSDDCLRFSVQDTGIGIPKAKQHRLFERFSQVDGTIQRDFGGSGLGLAICKRLVDLMGGEVGFSSEDGLGSTFWFTLPLPQAAVQPRLSAAPDPAAARKRGHLLLVEDVEINQELARAVLEAAGHAVDIVSDGAAAVTAVDEGRYDLVLMDVQMPGMDGMTATRLIRSLGTSGARLPIIAMTANVLPDQVRMFHEAGMDDHVGKPFNRSELYAMIDRWLPGGAAAGPVEGPARAEHQDTFDEAAYGAIVKGVGEARAAALLATLVQELRASFSASAATAKGRDELRFEAHSLISPAGSLGFTAMEADCRALEACTEADVNRVGQHAFVGLLDQVRTRAASTAQEAERRLRAEPHDATARIHA
ncbi:ATP-binding protein [Methylobacterium radiodurans]|uniref:histidine kinase n=1 Tax=Methylobacterium radiodurans TaxID=2202828 RepID=A0A2U8VZE2_9HYPH|nr:ATP-binding protein [Methylobacterium radiodurans]AWN38446.1 hypothetical protein DK427_24185 [Methylobacterium radiodurans]